MIRSPKAYTVDMPDLSNNNGIYRADAISIGSAGHPLESTTTILPSMATNLGKIQLLNKNLGDHDANQMIDKLLTTNKHKSITKGSNRYNQSINDRN